MGRNNADDCVILTTSEADAESALALVKEWMNSHELELHPEKTRIVKATDDPNGFDFLGYTFRKGMRLVRKKSLMAMRDKIRLHTRRSPGVRIPAPLSIGSTRSYGAGLTTLNTSRGVS
ncbi:MAG: reverse transcriptase domain-containing protein [Methylococcales bacterium]